MLLSLWRTEVFTQHERRYGLAAHDIVGVYTVDTNAFSPQELRLLQQARALLGREVFRRPLGDPELVKDYLRCKLAGIPHEVFGALWVDAQPGLIVDEVLFRGSLTCTSVYPRELLKRALALNAYGVLLYHSHPSPNATPSRADELMTETVTSALRLIDVKVLDHLVVSSCGAIESFAQRGLL